MTHALDYKPSAWKGFIRRETALYLGNDDSLRRDFPRDQYTYGASHYTSKRSLQDLVPKEFIHRLTPIVKAAAGHPISDKAAQEFVSRVAVTHVLFYWDNENSAESILTSGGTRLPHETRASLRYIQLTNEARENAIRTAVAPHALKYVLARSEKRDDVVVRLQELYHDRLFRDVRKVLWDTLVESEFGRPESVETLLSDIERVTSASNQPGDVLDMKMKVPFVNVEVSLTVLWDRVMNRRRYVMRRLVNPSAGRELLELAGKVFPEFR